MYGEIKTTSLERFCRVAGHKLVEGNWTLLSDEVEYWHLTSPNSPSPEKKWTKKLGFLPIRDLNFQYALRQAFTTVTSARGEQVLTEDVDEAVEYAERKLFEGGKPVYLPDKLAEKAADGAKTDGKPLGYNQILKAEHE